MPGKGGGKLIFEKKHPPQLQKIFSFLFSLQNFPGSQNTQLLQFFPGERFKALSPVFTRK